MQKQFCITKFADKNEYFNPYISVHIFVSKKISIASIENIIIKSNIQG